MSIQTIATPSGEKLVVMSMDDYEDLVDTRDYKEAARARNDAGGEWLDAADMTSLLAAPSPISFWRERRGMSRAALAEAASISEAELERIEAGALDFGVSHFARLAHNLGVTIDDLVIQ